MKKNLEKSESFQEISGISRSYMGFAIYKSVHLLSCRLSAAIYCDLNLSYMPFGQKEEVRVLFK